MFVDGLDGAAHVASLTVAIGAVAGGLMVTVVGALGWRGRLPRNRFSGIRTRASMRSEAAFRAANQAGGLLIMVGGAAAVAGGLVAFGLRAVWGDAVAWICAVAGVVVMTLLTLCGGILGDRAVSR